MMGSGSLAGIGGVGPRVPPNAAAIASASKKRASKLSNAFSYSRANTAGGIERRSQSRSAFEMCRPLAGPGFDLGPASRLQSKLDKRTPAAPRRCSTR
jgi:hypothetical protein